MSPINLAIVGLKLMAIYCFVQVVPLFSTSVFFLAEASARDVHLRSQFSSIFFTLLPCVSLLLLSIVLFVFSQPLARRIASSTSTGQGESNCTLEQVQAIAFAAAGLLILVTALPSVGRALQGLIDLYAYHEQGDNILLSHTLNSWLYSAGVIAQLVIGVLLLLNPKGFRNIWRFLRTAGT